ncbi:putative F-box protein At3g17500 [Raphanus sativus]|uniref:F-box protein At3g17500 n=1 Tax=Raphanus sativus TaxID=3726 RepID=A0A6J0LME2_RAPSA|nr:putative F-box protein At3g17500 [Raphanus sativus]
MTRETSRLLPLPWDLEDEILSRVPAPSLRRLRFSCKRWNALFKDQEFIKKHSDKAAKQHLVLMLNNLKVYSMNVNLHEIHTNVVDPHKLMSLIVFNNPEKFKVCKIFHCDGLLLCTTLDFKLVIWNPCTGQIRWIPFSDRYNTNSNFVLGYDNNKTYKILRCSRGSPARNVGVVEYGIYDFGSHSWKNLNNVTPKYSYIVSEGVSLKGNIYWIVLDKEKQYVLRSFHFSTKRFGEISIPFSNIGVDSCPTALSVVREERLAVLYSSISHPTQIAILMTTDDKIDQTKLVPGTKFLSVDLYKISIPRELISSETSFFIDEEKKAAVLCDPEYTSNTGMVFLVGEDNRFLKIPIREHRDQVWTPHIYNYVPSLVQIQQGTVEFLTEGRKRRKRH